MHKDETGHVSSDEPSRRNNHENYVYWQKQGEGWLAEYDNRKKRQVLYHLQEITLCQYLAQCAPARVLEYGCGVGRHLSYLREMPQLEVFGYDQSASMIANIDTWAGRPWREDHVVLGGPLEALPYADNAFDIVFTAEVLVHVNPEHVLGRLKEILRVAKRQVFHLETAPGYRLYPSAHGGCWYHDLVDLYDRLGLVCELVAQTYSAHALYRVVLDSSSVVPEIPPVCAQVMRRCENDIQPTIDMLAESQTHLANEINVREQRISELQHGIDDLHQNIGDLEGQLRATEEDLGNALQRGNELDKLLAAESEHVQELQGELQRAYEAKRDTEAILAQERAAAETHCKRITELESILQSQQKTLDALNKIFATYH